MKSKILSVTISLSSIFSNNISTASIVDEYDYINYSNYVEQTAHYDENHTGKLVFNGTCKSEMKQTKYTQGWAWGDEDSSFDTLAYAIYDVGVLNAAYYSEALGYIESGYVETTYTKKISQSYEKSLEEQLSTSISSNVCAGTNYNALNCKVSVEEEINSIVSEKTKIFNQTIDSVSTTIHYDITNPGYYRYDLRANFKMYVVQVYKINYQKEEYKTEKKGLWAVDHYYKYNVIGYELKESYLSYSLSENLGLCITKYTYDNDGKRVYDGPKLNSNYIYF